MKYFILYLLLFTGFATKAQPGPGNKEQKIEALYVAYMTRELNLTEEDAQKFWPVHAQYDNEIRALRSETSELERQQAVLNIKKKYQDRFTKILGANRTNDFYIKDGEFRKKLIERLKNMRQQNQNNGKPRQQLRRNNMQ
ncbi:MAG TPA: hypothetical protein VLR49_13085 [Ferruginibacter sp.]|nr:hypothetical protein [Ferruginibacter sp.]